MLGCPPCRWRWWLPLAVISWWIRCAWSEACSNGSLTFVRRPAFQLNLTDELQPFVRSSPQQTAGECYRLCREDGGCKAYFVDHRNMGCLLSTADHDLLQSYLTEDPAWSYYRKICLKGEICKHHWAFESTPGFQLYDYYDKTLSGVESEEDCIEACSREDTFFCRSARFDAEARECVLSRHDRRTSPESFKKSGSSVIYLENQCVEEPPSCRFQEQKSRILVHRHVHLERSVTTRDKCEAACLQHEDFTCRSYVFDMDRATCILSPEDSHTLPDPVSGYQGNGSFYEKESCIDVDVRCEATAITAVIRVRTPFRGRVYAVGHPYECYAVTVSEKGDVVLSMPLHGRRCGTRSLGNGTFVNSVVVQHHPFVLRTTDRRVDVACDFQEIQLKVRGGKQVASGELQSLTHVVTAVAATPAIRLRVVNSSNHDVKGVGLGDPLYLRVEMNDESVFGIFGRELIARSGEGSDTVLLIDDQGCPVEPALFPPLERLPDSKSLTAPFQAFKFTTDKTVKFQLTVSFCLDQCTPAECDGASSENDPAANSYGRRRRAAATLEADLLEPQPGDVITDVTMESPEFEVMSAPALEDRPPEERKQPINTEERVQKEPPSNLCLPLPVLYTVVAVVAAFQMVILGACVFILIAKRKFKKSSAIPGHLSGSRASISSKTGLFRSS